MEKNILDLLLAEPQLFGQRWAVIRQVLLTSEQENGPLFVELPDALYCRGPRQASADDDICV